MRKGQVAGVKGSAMELFVTMMRFENRMPTRDEFNEWWQGGKNYYYTVKKKFEENYDYYMDQEV